MTPDSRNKIRLFDHSPLLQTDHTIEVLRVRESGLVPDGFAERMAKTIASYPNQMHLLTALPVDLARPSWRQTLRSYVNTTSQIGRRAVVANDIITRGNDKDILALLKSADAASFGSNGKFHPHNNAVKRMAEFLIYDLFRHYGDDRIVRLLIHHGNTSTKKKKNELIFVPPHSTALVSVAFALAEIGGKDARQAIERWSKDEKLTERTTLIAISVGHTIEVKNGELFAKALKRLDETDAKHAEQPDPPRTKR